MARNRRLTTDRDFREVMNLQIPVRVFENDQIVDSGGIVIRFDDELVVLQSSPSQITYHQRNRCEFFETNKWSET